MIKSVLENENDVRIADTIVTIAKSNGGWEGTLTDLLSDLEKVIPELVPGSASSLRTTVNRVAKRIRAKHVSVSFVRDSSTNWKRLLILKHKSSTR